MAWKESLGKFLAQKLSTKKPKCSWTNQVGIGALSSRCSDCLERGVIYSRENGEFSCLDMIIERNRNRTFWQVAINIKYVLFLENQKGFDSKQIQRNFYYEKHDIYRNDKIKDEDKL